jgi:hypothetical protein
MAAAAHGAAGLVIGLFIAPADYQKGGVTSPAGKVFPR